ncbi:MAG: peptidoglycan DD-metalloendopeptidase family protein [Candidatus Berkelbacteria bacterium]|nr:MAG: peptidoglycan DD-metalloendopeptidase family protein [Candidatus Berkelbacteria bacterium]QQG51804.1 MAG: peptidoglycan DD-metalloendopeptidase family protein [Candidatus Berkelbacteria bacterium]
MKLLRLAGYILLGLVLVLGLRASWSYLKDRPESFLGHEEIAIGLPYHSQDEPTGIRPLGEIESVHPNGHEGIDFQWAYAAQLVATSDGIITGVTKAKDGDAAVLYVTLKSGEYKSVYKELESVASGIRRGTKVKQGDLLGYPHGTRFPEGHTNYQLHWEFGYDSFPGFSRLCPLEYFDADSKARIEQAWAKIVPAHTNPTGQALCNEKFAGLGN